MCRVDRARNQSFLGRDLHLRGRERADEREALAERAARVEVRRERNGGARVDQRTGRRHRPVQEERARREQDAGYVARRERGRSCLTRHLEVVDGTRAELDRERDGAGLRELVTVEAQRETCLAASVEVAARLVAVERAALEEDVRRLGDLRGLGKHVFDEELDVRVGSLVDEVGRNGVRAEPRPDTARVRDSAELGELGVTVEPVARLRLERRRARLEHPADVLGKRLCERVPARRPRRANRREDPTTPRVQLLVGRAAGTQ